MSDAPVSPAPPSVTSTRVALGCAVLFLLPFAAAGLFSAMQVVLALRGGDWEKAGFLTVFALVFGGVGLGGIGAVVAGRRRAEESVALEARHPEAPWLWRDDWAARRITDSSRGGMWGAWIFAALWNLISLPAAILGVRSALAQGNHVALLALLFPIIGIGLLGWAVMATARYRRFGVSHLELATLPAPVGHALEGLLRVPDGLRPHDGFRLVLTCIRRVTTGGGRTRSTSERVVWQEERQVPAGGGGVPVAFVIPSDAVSSDPRQSADRVLWRLDVSADVPGVDYAAAFEVPVFRTEGSEQPHSIAERSVEAAFAVAADYRQPGESRIRVSTTRRGTEIDFPRARNPAMAGGLTAFLAIWMGAVAGTIVMGAPLIFPIVFGAFGVFLVVAVLDAWLSVMRVTAGDDGVVVASGWLTPGRERTLRPGEVAEVTTRIGAQAGRTAYYDIQLVTTAGQRVPAGGAVRDKREAEWLAARLRTALGLG